MADWGNDTTYQIRLSSDPSPATGWTTITRAQAEAASVIPNPYRKGTWPDLVVEMTQPEKDVVDAAADADAVTATMSEVEDLVNGHIRAIRIRINDLRQSVSDIIQEAIDGPNNAAFRTGVAALAQPSQITPTANRNFIKGKVEDIQSGAAE